MDGEKSRPTSSPICSGPFSRATGDSCGAERDSVVAAARNRPGERAPDAEPIAVRVGDAARMTGLCRSKIFRLIASGEIEAVKVGKARIVFVDSLNAFLRGRAEAQRGAAGKRK